MRSHFMAKMQSVQKDRKKQSKLFQNFARSYLGIGWYNLLQIWYVNLPSSAHLSSKFG